MTYSKNGMQDEANVQFKEAFTLQKALTGSRQMALPAASAKNDKKPSPPPEALPSSPPQ